VTLIVCTALLLKKTQPLQEKPLKLSELTSTYWQSNPVLDGLPNTWLQSFGNGSSHSAVVVTSHSTGLKAK
jgi:hypothetical protein